MAVRRRGAVCLTVGLLVSALFTGCSPEASDPDRGDRDATTTLDDETQTVRPTDPGPVRAEPWEDRPVVELSYDMGQDLRRATGRERVVFTPDLRVCELVFRAWPNTPRATRQGSSLRVTGAWVEGTPVSPVVSQAGAPEDAPGTLIELPLEECTGPDEPVEAELTFTVTLGEGADDRLGVAPEEQVAWFAEGFPLLAWVRGQGWARDEAVDVAGETTTSEVFDLAELSVTAPEPYAVLGTGTPVDVRPSVRAGRLEHRFRAPAVRNVAVSVGRYDVREREVDGVTVRVGLPTAGTRVDAEQWLDVHADYLGRLEDLLGPFPYPDLWVTVTPSQSSGLEFPTALQYGDLREEELADLVSHEVAHQWFYSLVGNNQARDPWVDEAFATFAQAVVTGREDDHRLEDVPGRVAGYLGYPMEFWAEEGSYFRYYRGVYEQGAAVLLAARDSVGEQEFDAALRAYVDDHAHQVAGPESVEAAFAHLPEVVDLLREYGAFSAPSPEAPPPSAPQ